MANPKKKKSTTGSGIDLAKLFTAVTANLANNQDQLNRADSYNKNHGDNMVDIFNTIAQVIGQNSNLDQAGQLAKAGKAISKINSGSAQLYSQGLTRASKQFKGKTIAPDNAGSLLQALLGGEGAKISQSEVSSSGSDLLSSLLGSLGGSQSTAQQTSADDRLDIGDLLNAGLAFMNAKQRGSSNTEAIVNALIAASPLGQSSHRSQSGTLVANTIMQVLGSLAG